MTKKRNRKVNIGKLILRFFLWLVLFGLLIMPAALIVPRLFGYEPFTVISDSMTPTLRAGDLVYIKEADPFSFKEGDIICFYMNRASETPITHRVVSNDTVKHDLITKGDANEDVDIVSIPYNYVVGKVFGHLPSIGVCFLFLSTLPGKVAYVMLFAACVFLLELTKERKRRRRRVQRTPSPQQENLSVTSNLQTSRPE